MDEKEHKLLDKNPSQKPHLLIQFFRVHFSSGVLIMKKMWSRQVDELTLKCLISVHRHRSELNMKTNSEEKVHFL